MLGANASERKGVRKIGQCGHARDLFGGGHSPVGGVHALFDRAAGVAGLHGRRHSRRGIRGQADRRPVSPAAFAASALVFAEDFVDLSDSVVEHGVDPLLRLR